jgi:hypothetical protein
MKMLVTAVLKCERADMDAQAVMDWLDEAVRKAGLPIEMAQVLPYDPPAEPDPTRTEVAIPERPAPGPYGYTGGDHG